MGKQYRYRYQSKEMMDITRSTSSRRAVPLAGDPRHGGLPPLPCHEGAQHQERPRLRHRVRRQPQVGSALSYSQVHSLSVTSVRYNFTIILSVYLLLVRNPTDLAIPCVLVECSVITPICHLNLACHLELARRPIILRHYPIALLH